MLQLSVKNPIIVDSGEFPIIVELIDRDIEHTVMRLKVGDVVTSERTVIEVKRWWYNPKTHRDEHDFVASIKDQRSKVQSENMKALYDRRIVIVEGIEKLYADESIDVKSILTTMAKMSCSKGISIIPSRDIDDTIHIIMKILEFDQMDGHYTPFNKQPKPKTLLDSQIYLLTGLLQIRQVKAKQLLNEFGNPMNVFKAIINSEFIIPKRGKNKRLTGVFTKLRGFDSKFVLKNQKLLIGSSKTKKPKVNL